MGFTTLLLVAGLSGCRAATPEPIAEATLLRRAQTRQAGAVSITFRPLNPQESRQLLGFDAAGSGIQPVWIGQISRDIGVRLTRRTITTHRIDPAVDETRWYLLQDLFYSDGLERFGYVGGAGASSPQRPRVNDTGDPYITDGRRAVFWLTNPVETPFVQWPKTSQPRLLGEGRHRDADTTPR